MKKRLTSLFVVLCVALSLVIPASAAGVEKPTVEFETITEEEMIVNDAEFLADATVTTKDLGNDVYQIELRNQEEPCIDSEVGDITSTSAAIVAFGEEELEEIEKSIQDAVIMASSTGKTKSNNWGHMGNSIYLETTIHYEYKTASPETLYKMTSVTTKVQVRDGTTFSNRSVKFVSNMALQNVPSKTVTIPSGAASTYNVVAPTSWTYVSSTGLLYGVHFYCTAQRPSGESQSIDFYNDLFG